MANVMDRAGGIGLAGLLAGPFFVLMTVCANLYNRLPAPIEIDPRSVAMLFGVAAFAVIGVIIALPISALGTAIMLALGEWFPPARTRTAWTLAGGLLGGLGVWLTGAEHGTAFALVASSAFSGWVCSWDYRRGIGL